MGVLIDNALKPIIFKTSIGFVYYDYNDIILCSADGNCTNVFTREGSSPIKVQHKISFIEKKYCNTKFLRCHKSHIINLMHMEKLLIKTHQVQLTSNYVVPLSEFCWKKIRDMSETSIFEILFLLFMSIVTL
jgi:DNA-binding LytR/AlgR family response regulator